MKHLPATARHGLASEPRAVAIPRRGRVFLSGLACLLVGCATPSTITVATSANARDFYYERYLEVCAGKGPASPGWKPPKDCLATQAALNIWKKNLNEANTALHDGGKLPLQLKQLKIDEKETARGW